MLAGRSGLGRWLGALQERDFRLYWIGQLTSAVGTGMLPVALSFAVLESRHGSAGGVGLVLMALTVPLVLLLLVGGVAADRFGRRRVMLCADTLRACAEIALAAWIVAGPPPLLDFMVLAALIGTGNAFFIPAIVGIIPQLVPEEKLTQANALNWVTNSVGGILGPAAAGIIVVAFGPGWAVAGDAGTFVVSVVTLAALRLAPVAVTASDSFLGQLRAGWSAFWSRTWLWAIVVMFSAGNATIFAPFMVLGAAIAKSSLGGAAVWGGILGAQGLGTLGGAAVMLRMRLSRPLVVAVLSVLVWPYPLLALAFHAPVPVITVGAFLGGACLGIFGPLWETTIQREVPPELLSRVSAYDWFGSVVFLPLGYAIVGPISSVIGDRAVFFIACVYVVVSATVVVQIPAVRRIQGST